MLEHAVATLRGLPPEMQDGLAHLLLQLAGQDGAIVDLTPEDDASLQQSVDQAAGGEFATDEQVRAIWAKHGL